MPLITTVLTAKGETRKANLALEKDGTLSIETIQKYMRKKEEPEQVATFTAFSGLQLTAFAYTKGKAGTQNASELPAQLSKQPLFGDILLIAYKKGSNWSKPEAYLPESWLEQLEIGDEDEEEEEEEEEEVEEAEEEEEEEEEGEEEEEEEDEEEEVEMEEEPIVNKRKKVVSLNLKIDGNAFKDEIDVNADLSKYPFRQECRKKLAFLEEQFEESDIMALEKALLVHVFYLAKKHYIPRNWNAVPFQELYQTQLRTLLWNIHPKSPVKNHRLLRRCLEGEFALEHIPTMSAYDMFPERWQELADKQLIREQKILEGNKRMATDEYKCNRCHKRECTYYEMQTRSADEPTTIFITCLNCGKRWRH
jgi:transcription elongation factor S-II